MFPHFPPVWPYRAIPLLICCLLLIAAEGPVSVAASVDYLYAAGPDSSVRVFAADSGALLKAIPGSGGSSCLVTAGDSQYVYVAEGDSIDLIETDGNTVSASVSYPSASSAVSGMAIGTGGRLYVADTVQQCVKIYAADLANTGTISVNTGSTGASGEGYLPLYLAVSPDGSRLYVGCAYGKPSGVSSIQSDDYSLLVFDLTTGERLSVLSLRSADSSGSAGASKYRLASMALSPAGDNLWLGVYLADSSRQVMQETSQLLALSLPVSDTSSSQALYVPPVPEDLVFSLDGGQLFALFAYAGQAGIVSYDPKSYQIGRLYTVNNPALKHGALSPGTGKLYVSTDKGYTIVDLAGGGLQDVEVSGSVNRIAIVSKTISPTPMPTPAPTATPMPTPAPALTLTPASEPVTPTPAGEQATATPATGAATPFPTLTAISTTAAVRATPSSTASEGLGCMGMLAALLALTIVIISMAGTIRRRLK